MQFMGGNGTAAACLWAPGLGFSRAPPYAVALPCWCTDHAVPPPYPACPAAAAGKRLFLLPTGTGNEEQEAATEQALAVCAPSSSGSSIAEGQLVSWQQRQQQQGSGGGGGGGGKDPHSPARAKLLSGSSLTCEALPGLRNKSGRSVRRLQPSASAIPDKTIASPQSCPGTFNHLDAGCLGFVAGSTGLEEQQPMSGLRRRCTHFALLCRQQCCSARLQ